MYFVTKGVIVKKNGRRESDDEGIPI